MIYRALCSQNLRDCFAALFQKRAPARRERKKIGVSFVSFSFRLFCERKAAKESCYLRIVCLCNAFSFEEKGPKEKAWQKENAVLQGYSPRTLATARGEPLLKKWTKRFAWCGANTPINPNLSVTHEKTPPYSNIFE